MIEAAEKEADYVVAIIHWGTEYSDMIEDDGTLNYTFLAALQEDVYTDFIYGESRLDLFDKINSWSINAHVDKDGNVLPLDE